MNIWIRIFTIIIVVFLSGCSVFKSSLRESQSDLERIRQNNIITESLQSGEIEIPARLFAAMAGKDINFSNPDTGSAPTQSTDAPDKNEPVKITFRNETTTKDKSTVVTDSSSSEVVKEKVEKKTGGLFGFWGGVILAGFIIVVGGAWVIIKFYF